MSRTLSTAVIVLLLTGMRGSAHHSFAAEYDEKKLVSVSGTVASLKWTNPHAWLYVDVKDDRGKVVSWRFEMGSPNGLVQRGWTKAELKKGDHVSVDGFAAKTSPNMANARTITLHDGRKLFGGFASTPGNPFPPR